MGDVAVSVQGIGKRYGNVQAVKPLDLVVKEGDLVPLGASRAAVDADVDTLLAIGTDGHPVRR